MSVTLPTRVQIILNGRRYEADPAVVVANFDFFAHFYAVDDASAAAAPTDATHAPHAFKFRREMSVNCNDPTVMTAVGTSCTDALGYRTQLSALPRAPEGVVPSDAVSAKDIFDFGTVPAIVPDFFGPILVAARKGRLTPSPFLWNDYNYSEQEAIAFVVRVFGVAALVAQGQHLVTAQAVPLTQAAAPAPTPAVATESTDAPKAKGGEEDDAYDEDGMPRLNVGCSRCGTQMHSDATCPYGAGVPGVTLAAAAESEAGVSSSAGGPNGVSEEAARLAAQTMGIAFGIPRAAMEAVARLGARHDHGDKESTQIETCCKRS